ncbi:tetratricopeptide repeat protein [Sphaerisporangium sp. NBC_01403]|uniref:tetratricopeptide repeat protein n=1 Tax=Sphaerisporangium sp. NBC_01403 TaxID=2903599 RepID=UPI00325403D2
MYAGVALRRLQRLDEAVASISRATEMFKANSDIDAYCSCLSTLADCFRDDSRLEEALEKYREACAMQGDEGSGMTPSIAALTRPYTLAQVGECLGLLGHRAEAITTLTEAIALMEQFQLNYRQARALEALAAVLTEEGRTGESRRAYTRAAEVFEAIGDVEASSRCATWRPPHPDTPKAGVRGISACCSAWSGPFRTTWIERTGQALGLSIQVRSDHDDHQEKANSSAS